METFPFSDQIGKNPSLKLWVSSLSVQQHYFTRAAGLPARSLRGCAPSWDRIPPSADPCVGLLREQRVGAAVWAQPGQRREPSAWGPAGAASWRYSKVTNPPGKAGLGKKKTLLLLENTKKKYVAVSEMKGLKLFSGEEKATYCKNLFDLGEKQMLMYQQ